jgi:hypothetical protein
MFFENWWVAVCLFISVVGNGDWLRKNEGVPSWRLNIRRHVVLADVPFLPTHSRPQEQAIAAGQELQKLGVRNVDAGARSEARIQHECINIGLVQRAAGELREGRKLTPKFKFSWFGAV